MARTGGRIPTAAVVALGAACGLAVGLRAVVALEPAGARPLVSLPPIPVETLGLPWSSTALWPHQLQAAALDRMAEIVAALFLAAGAVALLTTLVLLVEAGASRWRETAVRAALGAGPGRLAALLLGAAVRPVALAAALGLLLGLSGGGALRMGWPGLLVEPEAAAAAPVVGLALAVLAGTALVSYTSVVLRTLRHGSLAGALASGARSTAGPGALLGRRALSALQIGLAGAVVTAAATLVSGLPGAASADAAGEVTLVPVTAPTGAAPDHWEGILGRIGGLPGVEAESLATPGALVGLGVRDHALVECGNCYRGGLPLPYQGAVADHHAVAPGFFDAAGLRVMAGRGLTGADVHRAAPVALVNEAFARRSFEEGDPVGRAMRVGGGMGRWHTVVGVVADREIPAVGGDPRPRPAVWLSALQSAPGRGWVLLRGDGPGIRAARDLLAAHGYAPGAPRTLARHRADARAPLRWMRQVALALAFGTLALALHGAHATALATTRRRAGALAVRRALGATDGHIVRHVLRGAAGVGVAGGLAGAFLGALVSALLRARVAGVDPPGAAMHLLVPALLVAASCVAALRAAREALGVAPARALSGRSGTGPEPPPGPTG
jgi:hypothetical protein